MKASIPCFSNNYYNPVTFSKEGERRKHKQHIFDILGSAKHNTYLINDGKKMSD
jgi:hypothetical protein